MRKEELQYLLVSVRMVDHVAPGTINRQNRRSFSRWRKRIGPMMVSRANYKGRLIFPGQINKGRCVGRDLNLDGDGIVFESPR